MTRMSLVSVSQPLQKITWKRAEISFVLLGILACLLVGAKADHSVCLAESGVRSETNGITCIWFEGSDPKNMIEITGFCWDSYCKPNKNGVPHVAKNLLAKIRNSRNHGRSMDPANADSANGTEALVPSTTAPPETSTKS